LLESMQKIALLYDASQAVLSTFDLDEVLNQILGIIRDYFQLQNGAVLLLDTTANELYVRAHLGQGNMDLGYRISVEKGLTGAAVKLKRPVYAPDVSKDPRYVKKIDDTQSEVAIPLMVRDQVVGVLDFQSSQLNYFDPTMVDLLTLFSTQASLALENARLYSSERRRSQQLEAINAVARQTTAVLELDELLAVVCRVLLEWFPSIDHVAVLMVENDVLRLRAFAGKLTPNVAKGAQLAPGAGLASQALMLGRSIMENNVHIVEGYIAGFAETQSEMCVPLIFLGEKLGVLALDSAKKGAFDQEEVQPLESVADICAAAIQNAHYFGRAKELAYIDGLTSIHNRRYFEMRVLEELERAQRFQGRLSIIMVDIDRFKKLNDEFGHLLGDEVLRSVSSILKQQLRKIDVVCRYGGEEFAIVVPEVTSETALHIADKLRRQIESFDFPGVPRAVTISCGVADFPTHGTTRDEVVSAADSALYQAKQSGRNRAKIYAAKKESSPTPAGK
jgi:diguanylate cyclase (GGDEF)-like protein